MKRRLLCFFLCLLLLFMGCGQSVLAGEISFELPVSKVRVMIDRNGYLPSREKYVLFTGGYTTAQFRVVREADWEVVYTGVIQKASAEADARYTNLGMGDFSALTEPGRYYIEQDEVGRSYTFEISETVYEPVFQGLVQNIMTELPQTEQVMAKDICDVSFGMHSMMLALQCHGVLFEKDNNLVMQLLELAEWLMSFQDEATGSMFEDYEATAAFCGVLTQSADTFGKYDANVSKEFTSAAKRAWLWMEKNPDMEKEYASAQYYAAAQRFKTEGGQQYKTLIEKYLRGRATKITEDKFAFYGSVIYLNTIKGTNRDLCTKIMQELVDETEEVSLGARENPCLVYTDAIEQNLQKVLLICFVDYITPSNEYAVIIENTLHYLMGRNETGATYLTQAGVWIPSDMTVDKTMEWNGIMLFCLSDLLNVAADEIE